MTRVLVIIGVRLSLLKVRPYEMFSIQNIFPAKQEDFGEASEFALPKS